MLRYRPEEKNVLQPTSIEEGGRTRWAAYDFTAPSMCGCLCNHE